MNELIVAKAGGTSNSDAESVSISLDWAEQAAIFIPSAPGKLRNETGPHAQKVTDMLIAARQDYLAIGAVSSELTDTITSRYENIVNGLGSSSIPKYWLDQISPRVRESALHSKDSVSMLGERLQAEIYEAQGYSMLDPGRSSHDLGSDPVAWRDWLSAAFRPGQRYVMPGNMTLVGGRLVTFSRGGSDTTGGFAAYGVNADLNLNLTDGCALSADPSLIDVGRLHSIDHLLYVEGRELGRNGTGLVHPAAMVPLMIGDIPTEIRNTSDRNAPYTTLDNNIERAQSRSGRVTALSLMEHVIVHRVHEPGMAEAVGRLAAFEAALADRGVTVIDSQGDGVDGQKYFVEAESASATHVAEILQKTSRFGTVEPGNEISLITLVGFMLENRILDNIFNLALNSGIDGKIWQTEGFPISTGQNSLRIGVSPDAAKEVLGRLHEASVESRL